MRSTVTSVLALSALTAGASAQLYPAQLIVKQGDQLGDSSVSSLNDPYVNGLNQVGFVAVMADTTRSIYAGNGVVFNSGSVTGVTGAEGTMGISNTLDFNYSPSVDGEDAVYTSAGLLLRGTEAAPGFPGRFSTFSSRPRMTANGTAVWVGGYGTTAGGATTTRVFYKNATPANPAATVPIFAGGHMVGGEAVTAQGIQFGYDVSDTATHYINIIVLGTTAATDAVVLVDGGTIAAREGSSTGEADLWQNFNNVGINESGQYVFSGDTNAATSADGFVAGASGILLREGGTIAGKTYTGVIDALSINNAGNVAFIADTGGTTEALFYAPLNNFGAAVVLLETGASIDINNDNTADYVVTDFNASPTIAPGLDIPEDGSVYVNVDISDIGGTALGEAIIRVGGTPGPSCDSIDFNADGLFPDTADIDDFLSVFSGGPCSTGTCGDIDFNNDGLFPDTLDIDALLSVFSGGDCL